jgi:hypothetical protein
MELKLNKTKFKYIMDNFIVYQKVIAICLT